MQALTYNAKSGHVKLDKAVIGRIDGLGWKPYIRTLKPLTGFDLSDLLAQIRRQLEATRMLQDE